MRRLVALALVAACHHDHEHDTSERDTKGRGSTAIGEPTASAIAKPPKPIRVHRAPLLADVNGDGHDDAIVVMDRSSDPFTYAALDGMTGEVLWKSQAIEHWTNPLYVTGGRVLSPTDTGELVLFDFKAEAPAWTVSLGERVSQLCEAPADTVRVDLVDKRSIAVALATGTQTPILHPTPCVAIPTNRDSAFRPRATTPATRTGDRIDCASKPPDPCAARAKIDLGTLDWIVVDKIIIGGDAGDVLVGRHRPGTDYPVVGLLHNRAIVWKSDIPAGNPLGAKGASNGALASGLVVFGYQVASSSFVTAFALDTGNRKWNVSFDFNDMPQISASRDTIFAFARSPDALVGFAPDSGAVRFSHGRPR